MTSADDANRIKMVLLGHGGVGKSSLFRELMHIPFNPRSESTLGAAFSYLHVAESPATGALRLVPTYERHDDPAVRLHKIAVWDTAGQERFHSLLPLYYRGANIAIVVTDGSKEAGVYAERAAADLRRDWSLPGQIIALCHTKSDLPTFRRDPDVERAVAPDVAGVTSALTGDNVEAFFIEVIQTYLQKVGRADPMPWDTITPGPPPGGRRCC